MKSHQDHIHLLGHEAQWKARGNDAADVLAKQALEEFNIARLEQQPEWRMADENKRLDQAFQATQFLHELSLVLFKARNSGNTQHDVGGEIPEEEPPGHPPADSFQTFPFETPVSFPGKKWDGHWLTPLCHYFAQLRWTSCPAPLAGEISCLEVLIDLLISFQIYTPLNKKNLKRKYGHTSHFQCEHISVVKYLPSSDEAALLPPPFLTECHATWLNTIDFLKPLVNLLPVERTTRRSLAHPTCCQHGHPDRSSWQAAPHPNFWHPSARKLKYRCVIPRRPRKPLPPFFGEDFN